MLERARNFVKFFLLKVFEVACRSGPAPYKGAMTAVDVIGTRRQGIVRLLLEHKDGLSVDQLAASLGITRTAVREHLAGLERDRIIAQAKSQLAENAFKTAEVTKSGRSEILRQLQGVTEKLAEAEQSRMAALDRMGRLEIRAPRTGTVQELAIHTVGGIVGPGQTLMQIIPANDTLLVTAKISPTEIDQVHVGQHATVKISSFKMATPPELDGTVTGLSADKVVDERSGQAFFKVNISIAPGERSKLEGKELTPGLPAEVLILGESRRVITYLTEPLTDKIGLAFREK